jgi:hypothetical protein
VDNNKLGEAQHAWTNIWLTPAAIAGAVLIAFILFFKEEGARATDEKKMI